MTSHPPTQIVDLFAGPGGLGEGFAARSDFDILVSAEKETDAHKTLRLRAYFRLLNKDFPSGLPDYYDYCNGFREAPWSVRTKEYWDAASNEALQLTLGTAEDNKALDAIIENKLDRSKPWVLIGGPPCQAYSIVGRARNKGIASYSAEQDNRHFLYKEYLRIIQKYSPSVFVMENVKGILSSKIGGKSIFHEILSDLSSPGAALKIDGDNEEYVICSLATGDAFRHGDCVNAFDSRKFIIRSEDYGIPQARHRVILLGIKESLYRKFTIPNKAPKVTVCDAISNLPPLRSKLSKQDDSSVEWAAAVSLHVDELIVSAKKFGSEFAPLIREFDLIKKQIRSNLGIGALRLPGGNIGCNKNELTHWYQDPNLLVHLNHEARGHMTSDLRRYVYAAAFARAFGRTPNGTKEFQLDGLRPAHKNWASGKFSDRFRVQVDGQPATTVTSHISKDGNYFIHPDPSQCRSLTVREAARLQTFPDNYFFQGNRTQQFHQVGNAVPPLLAHKIAKVVSDVLKPK